jgi:hypothetical protein
MDYLERYDNQPNVKTVMTALTKDNNITNKFFDWIKRRADLKLKIDNQAKGASLSSLEDGLWVGVSTNDKSLIDHCINLGADSRNALRRKLQVHDPSFVVQCHFNF